MYQLDRIKAAQNLRGFSHSKTAEALDTPLATFKKYLSGERTLPHDFWKKASQLFNVPLSFFDVKNLTTFSMSEVNFRARARIKAREERKFYTKNCLICKSEFVTTQPRKLNCKDECIREYKNNKKEKLQNEK